MIRENLENIRRNIARAAQSAGRSENEVTLVAVSKTVEAGRICEAVDCGVEHIGENYVQELCNKYDFLPRDKIIIHFIGHLQRNKVKYIVDKVDIIESVDSLGLGAEIDRRCEAAGKVMDILIEVNIGGEESKDGVSPDEAGGLAAKLSELEHIRVRGLMCIPPEGCGDEVFIRMKALADGLGLPVLSMGMSGDYERAVRCGATSVRIGTAIFGKRNYIK